MSPELVSHIRIVEDSLAFILLTIAGLYLTHAIFKLRGIPIRFIPIGMLLAFIPLYFWKILGAFRRIFLDKNLSPEMYKQIHDIGEVFETLSGLVIAVVILFLMFKIRAMTAAANR